MSAANNLKAQISKDLRAKANEFLNSKKCANHLVDIIAVLEQHLTNNQSSSAALLTLEVIFTQLLKRAEMIVDADAQDDSADTKYKKWLLERFEETLALIISAMEKAKYPDATQAMVTAMKLLTVEAQNPIKKTKKKRLPFKRLRAVLAALCCSSRSQAALVQRFKEYAEYLDVVFNCWKLLPELFSEAAFKNDTFACNYLELMNILSVSKTLHDEQKYLCAGEDVGAESFVYGHTRSHINKTWQLVMDSSNGSSEAVHKQMLIVLLERMLPHLEQPILLTDFLMDSLDHGGAISLLALQGIFTLIQKHNITYPNIYEKLYSMFDAEIFHTKFKARLFYLADIFLTSTHLPENLVAAFVKRLARLSLIAPPQDTLIILQFMGNLILRHTGLRKLICASAPAEVDQDPFQMDECDPIKSKALESSLWEVVLLQKHALPSIAAAAKFISQPLPSREWELAQVLELKEDEFFQQEASKKSKQFPMSYERPKSLYLAKDDKLLQHWQLFE